MSEDIVTSYHDWREIENWHRQADREIARKIMPFISTGQNLIRKKFHNNMFLNRSFS